MRKQPQDALRAASHCGFLSRGGLGERLWCAERCCHIVENFGSQWFGVLAIFDTLCACASRHVPKMRLVIVGFPCGPTMILRNVFPWMPSKPLFALQFVSVDALLRSDCQRVVSFLHGRPACNAERATPPKVGSCIREIPRVLKTRSFLVRRLICDPSQILW